MSVSASFIEGLLSTSGDSNEAGSGDADSDADSGAGEGHTDTGAATSGGGDVSHSGNDPAAKLDNVVESGEQTKTADPPAVAEPAKPTDEPTVQIGRLNGALREVRGENKELKSQLIKQAEQFAALQKQVEALSAPKVETAEETGPDFLASPKDYVDAVAAKTAAALKKLEDGETQRTEQSKKQEEMQQQWGEVINSETEFAAETPDYHDAIQYVRNIRMAAFSAEFEAMNDRAPNNAEISKALTQQEIQGALTLQAKGKNPAQWYYGYAKSIGYKPAQAVPQPAAEVAPAPAAKPAAPKPNKEAVRSMGSGGGDKAPPEEGSGHADPMASLLGAVHGEMTAKRKARRS